MNVKKFCDYCRNKDLCKFVSTATKVCDAMDELVRPPLIGLMMASNCPIKVEVSCTRFEGSIENGSD